MQIILFRKKIDSTNSEFEKEKQRIKTESENERQRLIKSHEKALDDIQNQFHAQIMEINQASKSKCDHLTAVIENLSYLL